MTRILRLPALLLALCLAVALSATAGAATRTSPTYPSVSKVSPLKLGVGDTLTLRGKNFRTGKGRNVVVFKRKGGRAVFVKAGKATRTRLSVAIPAKLLTAMAQKSGKPVATRFAVRVLTARLGRRFTSTKASPVIGPKALTKAVAANDCDGDLTPNTKDLDDDNDLLSDTLEATLKTDPCKRDSDGDGMSDGWEHESALDYNGRALPTPLRRPYPNALNDKDAAIDSDGDGLTNLLEYAAWATYGGNRRDLNYSGGNPATTGKERAVGTRAWWDRDANGFLSDNERDADGDGLPNQDEGGLEPLPVKADVVGFFSDAYLGLEAVRNVVDVVPLYGPLEYVHKLQGTSWLDKDSDGDTIGDAADDQDGDGVSNVDEVIVEIASKDKLHRQVNPCEPNLDSRLCIVGDDDIDDDGLPNRADTDDDGDGLGDGDERRLGLNPFKADTDGDAVGDGYEYQSALDLNSSAGAAPYPGKRPYPNPLDGADLNEDYDGDGLTLSDEYRAWRFSGSPSPLDYSDGALYTGGRGAPVADSRDTDGSGFLSDDERDVDADGLGNWDEAHGRMTPKWWELTFTDFKSTNDGEGIDQIRESVYPGRTFKQTDFVDADTDGDGILDGADDEDHDGFTNAFELQRPADWEATYVSTTHPGTNPRARVNPFNPCKPFYSSTCHRYPPFDYYQDGEDWQSPVRSDGP